MKKLFSYILIFALGMATAAGAIFSPRAFAHAADGETSAKATTEIFLPTTYLQYYKLEKPYAICREEIDGKEFVAISHKGAIVLYSDGKFKEIKVEDLNAAQGVPSLQLYEQKYLLFSAGSKLWTIDTETNIATETEIAGNDFSICGNELAIATSSNISFYTLSTSSGGLGYAKETDKTISMNGVLSVLKSKNGKTYFFNTNTNTIHSVADGETDVNKIETLKKVEGVRSLAESGDESDENIYYSCVDGIFAVNTSTKTDTTIKLNETGDAADKDLGKFWQPQGICLTGKGIWVVDSEINAVQEINLTPDEKGNYNFTDFAITTNSRAINRLSVNAADVAYGNGTVYALDENRIVVIENADGDKDSRTYHLIDLPVNAGKFAVGGGYLAYQRSEKQITYGKIAAQKETEENKDTYDPNKYILDDEKTFELKVEGSDKILDVCYGDKAFYVLSTVLSGGKNHPYVVKIDCVSGNETPMCDMTVEGISKKIAVDPFDKIYAYAVNGDENVVYSFGNDGKASKVYSSTESLSDGNVVKMQTDFDGKLYFLSDNGKIVRLDGEITNGVTSYKKALSVTVKKSENLAGVGNPVSFCACAESRKAYFIFGGLILRLDESGETAADITTVNTVPVPENFSFAYSDQTTYGKTTENAKLFRINPKILDGKYFEFIKDGYLSETENADYAFVKINEKYSLAINSSVAAIIRNSDVATASSYKGEELSLYSVVGFDAYALPVLSSAYKTSLSFESGENLKIVGKLDFNEKTYYLIDKGGEKGYIDSSFTTDKIAVKPGKSVDKSAYVYDKRGVTVYDEKHAATGKTIKGKKQVRVISSANGYSKVRFSDGTVGFVKNDVIIYDSASDFVKCIVAILCASSFLVLALFFERKYLFGRD